MFRLPPNSPLYLETTFEERLTEYWAHTYQENPKMLDAVEDESFDADAIMQQWAEEAAAGAQQAGEVKPAEIDINDVDDWEDVNAN